MTTLSETTPTVLERTFDSSEVEALQLSVPHADVFIRGGSTQIRISASLSDDSSISSFEERFSARLHEATAKIKLPSPPLTDRFGRESRTPRVRIEVTVPSSLPVDASVLGGTLDASGLEARTTLECHGGSIEATRLSGRAELRVLGGTLTVARCHFTRLHLHASGADTTIAQSDAEQSTIYAAAGSLELRDWRSETQLECHGTVLREVSSSENVTTHLSGCRGAALASLAGDGW